MKKIAFAAAAALSVALAAPASAQSVTFTTGTIFSGPSLTGFSTEGDEMGGMLVTWTYADGLFGSASWGNLGSGTWGVNSGGFRVSMGANTNTFGGEWSVRNNTSKTIRSIRFNGANGRTLFDCDWDTSQARDLCSGPGSDASDVGTSGSANGWTFENDTRRSNVSAEYSNLYKLNSADAPVGDLFEQLTITFGNGLEVGGEYSFYADTDNSSFNAPPPTAVPEPASLALIIPGLAALGLAAKRRRA